MYPKQLQWFYNSIDAFFSLFRLLWISRFTKTKKINKKHSHCIVLGNGPSLNNAIKSLNDISETHDLIAINFMGTTDIFAELKPETYVLCDPAFWFDVKQEKQKEKVLDFYQHLTSQVTWEMQLYLPWQACKEKEINQILKKNNNITICYYNKTKVEGFRFLKKFAYRKQLGMPRAQNVLVAALMLAIYSGYSEIYLIGSENDWLKNLWVDEKNKLRLNDFHFYDKEDAAKNARTMEFDLATMLSFLYFMFKGYHEIEQYSKTTKSTVFNATPESFIDAFKRKSVS